MTGHAAEPTPPRLVERLDLALATQVAALQRRSYAVEAELLGVAEIPPMRETPRQLVAAGRQWLVVDGPDGAPGAVLAFEDEDDASVTVSAVAVEPALFRRGLARRLLESLDGLRHGRAMTVMTGDANAPARRLYETHGFAFDAWVDVGGGVRLARYRRPAA